MGDTIAAAAIASLSRQLSSLDANMQNGFERLHERHDEIARRVGANEKAIQQLRNDLPEQPCPEHEDTKSKLEAHLDGHPSKEKTLDLIKVTDRARRTWLNMSIYVVAGSILGGMGFTKAKEMGLLPWLKSLLGM